MILRRYHVKAVDDPEHSGIADFVSQSQRNTYALGCACAYKLRDKTYFALQSILTTESVQPTFRLSLPPALNRDIGIVESNGQQMETFVVPAVIDEAVVLALPAAGRRWYQGLCS